MIDPNHNPNPEFPGVTPVPFTEPTPLQPPPDPFKPEPDPFKPEPDPSQPDQPGQPDQPSIPIPRAHRMRPARMTEEPTQPLRAPRATPPGWQRAISEEEALDLGPSFSASFASPFAIARTRGDRPSRVAEGPTRPMRPLRMMATPGPFPVPDPMPSPEHEPNPLPGDPMPGPQPSPNPDPSPTLQS